MDRRSALSCISAGIAGAALTPTRAFAADPARASSTRAEAGRLKLGCQKRPTTETIVQSWKRFGVTHCCGSPVDTHPERGYWTVDELSSVRDLCERSGLVLAMMWEPFLTSTSIDNADRPAIMLGKSPDRDRDIECFQKHIENCAAIDVKCVKYNLTIIGVTRTERTTGRGRSSLSTWRLDEAGERAQTLTRAGRVTADDYWERITYFLERVIPVCKQHDVRMAAHPYDPPGLPFGYQGAENWDSPSVFEGFKRYEKIVDSPYNGFQLCLGTAGEGLKRPLTEVLPIVQYLGERGKIHQIHMRNIRGGLNDFAEVYPDEGDMDFFKVMRILRDTQFAYSICADHMPSHPDDPGKLQAFAYGNGYIKALIDAVNSEVQT